MNTDTLIEYVVIKKTQVLTYDEKLKIIETILKLQEKLPQIEEFEITALGLQTLSDSDLVVVLHDTLFLDSLRYFNELQKKDVYLQHLS